MTARKEMKMKNIAEKQADGSIKVYRNGQHVYTIRKNSKKGYDKYLIMNDGAEYLAPAFSWFPTLTAAKSFCECK